MIITCSKSGVIDSIHKSLTISTELNERRTSLVFQTTTQLEDYETITVKRDDNTVMFSGVVERIKLDNTKGGKIYTVRATGLVKLFDMQRVAKTYENSTAQEIVEDIIDTFTGGFTHVNVTGSVDIKSASFNYVKPSDAIRQIAESIGYSWYIDNLKDVHFFEKTTTSAPISVVDNGNNYWGLQVEPDTREIANVILVRGGSYLSSTQEYIEVADGEKTKFVLPEKPKDTKVYVDTGGGYVLKTLAPQFGEETPTTDFQVNYNEKYIQNGTHATLSSGDKIKVEYKFEVPLRLLRKDNTSINALKAIFTDTNGEFYKIIEDKDINSRELADEVAKENIALYGNAKLNGSFNTTEHNIEVGQILTVDVKGYTKDVVVTKVSAKNNGGDLFIYNVSFSTVLFGFEDFLRGVLQRSKIELNDNETVELVLDATEDIRSNDTVTATVDANRQNEDVTSADEAYSINNKEVTYVHSEYFPTGFTDTKRVGLHTYSPFHTGQKTVQFTAYSADGFIEANSSSYTTAHNATSGTVFTGSTIQYGQQKHASAGYFVWRAFFTFDTSSIPDGATITAATLKIKGTLKLDSGGVAPVTTVVSNNQSSNTSLVGGDFDQLGTTSFGTIDYASFSTSAYNDIALNASGIAVISKTGYTKLGLRTDKDISATTPPSNHTSQLYINSSESTGNEPILEITYEL